MIEKEIKILVTGDFCPINRVEKLANDRDYASIFNDLLTIIRENDFTITDLECPLTTAQSTRIKIGPHQKAHPNCIEILKYAGVNLVAMANNHIMDYGEEGVLETINLCKDNDLNTIGIGRSSSEAARPFSVRINNKGIAILNFADDEFITSPNKSFQCNTINPVRMLYDISEARENNDYVVVILHSGNEFFELPSPRTKQLFRYIIDLGADVVFSHHTHAFSGYEIYNSKLIFYGLGNFIYDWPGKNKPCWYTGYNVRLTLHNKIDFEIIPHQQVSGHPGIRQLSDEEKREFFSEIDRLNQIIADDQILEEEFMKYCRSVFPMYNSFIEPNFGRWVASLRKRKFFPNFLTRRKKLILLNLVRCESHRDVLIRMLNQYE